MTKEDIKAKIDEVKFNFNVWSVEAEWKLRRFWNEHKDEILVLGPVALGAGGKIVNSISRQVKINKEIKLKERFMYNRSLGCYHELRRQPTKREYLEIDRRKKSGESLAHILKDMRLLK